MARNPEGWKCKPKKRTGVYHVRFTYQGIRREVTTGTKDPREASERAPRIYADAIEGRLTFGGVKPSHPGTPLAELTTEWIEAIAPQLGPKTPDTYTVYAGHWIRHFGTIGNITTASIGKYDNKRLASVQRVTLNKERFTLGIFLRWCKVEGKIQAVPEFPEINKKATGTPHKQGRAIPGEPPSEDQVEAILGELSGQAQRFHVALYETALRPISTLRRLLPGDLTPFGLHIRKECDKNRKPRTIPVSTRARLALAGVPFTEDHSDAFYAACRRLYGDACPWTPYDLKHSRITRWLDEGKPIGGISELTGVSVATLTKRYAHATRRAAELVLWGHTGAIMKDDSCEGRDLNPDGSYPASTSSKSGDGISREKQGGRRAGKVAEKKLSGAQHQNQFRVPAGTRIAVRRAS